MTFELNRGNLESMDSKISFYNDLVAFQDFSDLTQFSQYSELPGSWWIFLTDIEKSTEAIEQGRYREVNMIGAASISVSRNALEGKDFPYVFGGDGATLCVPSRDVRIIEESLGQLQNYAKEYFDLSLRVAKIPAVDIFKMDRKVWVAKFEMAPGRSIAMFQGGGLGLADQLAKQHYDQYKIQPMTSKSPDLKGLSCRWNPVPAKKGLVLSLLVQSQNGVNMEDYALVLGQLQAILDGDLEAGNPIHNHKMSYRSFREILKSESFNFSSYWRRDFIAKAMGVFFAYLLFKVKLSNFFTNIKSYQNSIGQHSDFRKFDDTLRMVIDCTEIQKKSIEDYLMGEYQKGTVFFGTHVSKEALMTCFVESTDEGGHIHFVDGADGGYAMAAKQLKQQISQNTQGTEQVTSS